MPTLHYTGLLFLAYITLHWAIPQNKEVQSVISADFVYIDPTGLKKIRKKRAFYRGWAWSANVAGAENRGWVDMERDYR